MLPTHWQKVVKEGVSRTLEKTVLRSSQVQGRVLLCVYSSNLGTDTVQRIVPGGYDCISDGHGLFKCMN